MGPSSPTSQYESTPWAADYWASSHSNLNSLEIMLIEKVFGDKNLMEALLQEREIYWQCTLMTLESYGLNKRDELYAERIFQNINSLCDLPYKLILKEPRDFQLATS